MQYCVVAAVCMVHDIYDDIHSWWFDSDAHIT